MEKIPESSGVQLNLLPAKVQSIVLSLLMNDFVTFTKFLIWTIQYTAVETSADDSITNELDIELHGVSNTLEVDITQLQVLGAITAFIKSPRSGWLYR